jgi:hypothetical protein
MSKLHPKLGVLSGVVEGDNFIHVDLANPSIVLHGFLDTPWLRSIGYQEN